MIELKPEPLTARAFAPFGEVIDPRAAETRSINFGLTTRFHDLATVDVAGEGARALVNVFRTQPIELPHRVRVMERHPLGSQAFIPMRATRFLVLVGEGADAVEIDSLRLFIAGDGQGVNYFRNTWHHYQMVLDRAADFLVIDRSGEGDNLDEREIAAAVCIPRV